MQAGADGLMVISVSSPGLFDLAVVQQSDPLSVTQQGGAVSQFALSAQYNNLGFLAHNYLAGAHFYELTIGDLLIVTYTDKSKEYYKVGTIQVFGRSADWRWFTLGEIVYSDTEYFDMVYTGKHVTLQTCYGDWGVLVIRAYLTIDCNRLCTNMQ